MSGKHDRLAPLQCIDSLEVGPVRVEPGRLVTRYAVHADSGNRSTELVVKYEEPVFTPDEPASANLAAMVCAQVALNYGLFCKRIVFHGIHDRHDRRFLDDMARNTAREIYVKKFLQPNPFLVGPAASLPVVKQDHYLRTVLAFDPPGSEPAPAGRWQVAPAGHAVLSSGGKDSLLSFGLLDEIGCNPHAVFVNESGRHWFTALNAYRHLRERFPATHRVWTNADRVFAWMLRGRHPPDNDGIGGVAPHARPEVTKLRFDPVRSPPETVPVDLRGSLLPILLAHADGAVKKSGRIWIDFEPESGPSLVRPYEFTSPRTGTRQSHNDGQTASGFLLGELTWPDAAARLREVDVALLPVGAVEQHGHHLPLDTDAFDADYLAREVARACSDPRPIVLPLIPYGISYHHEDFAGTLSISPDTLRRLVYEVGMGAARNGITKLVIVNGHGGNTPALKFAAQLVNRDAHIFSCVESGETSDADILAVIETPNDVHAGEVETSTSLATRPHLVHLDAVRAFVPAFSSRYLDFSSKRAVEWYARTAKLSDSGVLGDPTRASREKGEKFWRIMIRNLVEFVEDIKGMTLDEIYQRRY